MQRHTGFLVLAQICASDVHCIRLFESRQSCALLAPFPEPESSMKHARAALALFTLTVPLPVLAEQVGKVGVDYIGNDIVVEALADPQVQGVTCHIAYFERSTLDRLVQGNWFEDPSNSSIACRQTGPITLGDISTDPEGEEIFSANRSLIFKSLKVTRIYDRKNNSLIYLAHASDVTNGSAKMSISTVPLWQTGVTPPAE